MHNAASNINLNKVNVDKGENQMTTQQKIQRPSDDPVVAVRSLALQTRLSQISQYYETNIPDAESWMDITQTALNNIIENLNDVKKLCVQGSTDTYNDSDRETILQQLEALQESVFAQGNADYAGRTVFTGFRTDKTLVFTDDDRQKNYNITENLFADNFETYRYFNNKVTVPANKDEIESLDAGKTNELTSDDITIQESMYKRLRLSYDKVTDIESISFTSKDASGNTVSNKFQLVDVDATRVPPLAKSTDKTNIDYISGVHKTGDSSDVTKTIKSDDPGVAPDVSQKVTYDEVDSASQKSVTQTDNAGNTITTVTPVPADNSSTTTRVAADGTVTVTSIGTDGKSTTTRTATDGTVTTTVTETNGATTTTTTTVTGSDGSKTETKTTKDTTRTETTTTVTRNGESTPGKTKTTTIENGTTTVTGDSSIQDLNPLDEVTAVTSTSDGSSAKVYVFENESDWAAWCAANTDKAAKNTVEGTGNYTDDQKKHLKFVPDDSMVLIKETGDLIFGKTTSDAMSAQKAAISVNYDKNGFSSGELKPEYYFDCVDNTLVDYNRLESTIGQRQVYDRSTIDYDINYTVAVNQTLTVNLQANDVFDSSIQQDMKDLTSIISNAKNAKDKVDKLDKMLLDAEYQDAGVQKKLTEWKTAAQKEYDFYKDYEQKEFERVLGNVDDYISKANLGNTMLGCRGDELKMTKLRMDEQQESVTELKSKNDNMDLSTIMMNYTAYYTAYNASLIAAGKLGETSLLNYI